MALLSHFIAKRIYSDSGDTKKVSLPAVRIATLGMAIGLAVMIISVAVVMGFKHSIRDKVVGFGCHAVVQNFGTMQDINQQPVAYSDSLSKALSKAPGVKHVQRYVMKQGLLKTDDDFLGVMFKGVAEDWDSTFIHENMVSGKIPAFHAEQPEDAPQPLILISQAMADKLRMKVGDKVFSYYIGDNSVRTRRFVVSGIYQTNLSKYDEAMVFCDMYVTQRLNNWNDDQVTGMELSVKDFDRLDMTARWLIKNVNRKVDKYDQTYTSQTIQEVNPQIFTWLGLLDLNVWIILALMVCVASVTMISGLLIIILERIPMIGMLKALGARNGMIRHTFLWFATFIIIKGLIIGNILGIGLCLMQQYTGIVKLDAQTYYVSEVPVELSIPIIVLLNIGTLIVSMMVLILPSFFISHISPVKSMKFGE